MKVSDFDFDLPPELVAQTPAIPRDSARLLHVQKSGLLEDLLISDLTRTLTSKDLLIVNNTRVLPVYITGKLEPNSARIRITLHKNEAPGVWRAFARPAKKLKSNDKITFSDNFSAHVEEKLDDGEVILKFNINGTDFFSALHKYGNMPLPPYIKRPNGNFQSDRQDYQTIFAAIDGAVASPTASLHFTPVLMNNLKKCGMKIVEITLHVGAGTYLPIKVKNAKDHKIHSEWGELSAVNANVINDVKANGGRIIAVGTTVLRLIETATNASGKVSAFSGETKIFITPGYKFKAIDVLLTNFHLPKTTLFMLVAAFCGLEKIKAAYDYAIKNRYRFFSYGDATLIELNNKS